MKIKCKKSIYYLLITPLLLPAFVFFIASCEPGSIDGINNGFNDEADLEMISESNGEDPENDRLPADILPRVAIYSGRGSWDMNITALQNFLHHHGYQWFVLENIDIEADKLKDLCDLIWFPGGFSAEYMHYMSDHSVIRNFVEIGGIYVGSCAGAYYASSVMSWYGSDYDYPLNLFNGKAIGPLAGLVNWGDKAILELESDHPANRDFEPLLEMYYCDGPYFEPSPVLSAGDYLVLARYGVNSKPAVIAGTFGTGKYLLIGTHPELGGCYEETALFDLEGAEGSQWPWLNSLLYWLAGW